MWRSRVQTADPLKCFIKTKNVIFIEQPINLKISCGYYNVIKGLDPLVRMKVILINV